MNWYTLYQRMLCTILFFSPFIQARSFLRKKDPHIPEITTCWQNSKRIFKKFSWAYTESPIFTVFNKNFFDSHTLSEPIKKRNNTEILIDNTTINGLIQELLLEITRHKKIYKHFTVIRDRNFNYKKKCGLLILKFKEYPLVLKLFMENPRSFIDSQSKGFENQFFFYMSGGVNRHIAGLTRIKNLELISEEINKHERWHNTIITPRKWYWVPKKNRLIQINGKNIGNKKQLITHIPSTYAIIADELDVTENLHTLSSQKRNELIMQLCMDLRLFIDPHADNFIVKYRPEKNDYTISIVDTEHFPSMVGLKEEPFFNNHFEWYIYLATKFFQDAFLKTKESRQQSQSFLSPYRINW